MVDQKHLYNQLIKDLHEIVQSSNQDLIQENANVDGKSPMGVMSLFASTSSKLYGKNFLLSNQVQESFVAGAIKG